MKTIYYIYAVGGPPVDHYYPKMAAYGDVVTYLVTPTSQYNMGFIQQYSKEVIDLTALSPNDALAQISRDVKNVAPDALFTFAEFLLKGVSEIAREIGLKCVGPNIDKARNKVLMRSAWQEVDIPQPKFVPVYSFDDIEKTTELALPFIIKVAYGAGSIAQQIVDDHSKTESAIRTILDVVKIARETGDHEFSETDAFPILIAEELINSTTDSWYEETGFGDFVSVEGLVKDGEYFPLAMTGRLKTVPPFTELGNIAPCILSADKKAKIVDLVSRAINALKLENCATHTELKLKANGEVSFLETSARMGGVAIALELQDVFGFDYTDLYLRLMLSEPVAIPAFEENPPTGAAASVALIGCTSDGTAWSHDRIFEPNQPDWGKLIGTEGSVKVVYAQSISPGSKFGKYDYNSGVLNYAGQAYLQTADSRTIKDAAYRLIDGLEQELTIWQEKDSMKAGEPSHEG